MRVAITGSSGLIGSALKGSLEAAGVTVHPVVRRDAGPGEISWAPMEGTIDAAALEGVDAVVHLAGAGIGDKRWTPERKRVILESRSRGTATLARALADLDDGPKILLSGSAIGYYGDRGDEVLTEESAPGDGFMSEICTTWEQAAQPAIDAGVRTCFLRTGIVQSTDGGALGKMLPLFKLALGGRFGSGEQWLSWISIDDHIRAIRHLLETSTLQGPVNLTAPEPVTNKVFAKALGAAVHRPAVVPVPQFAPRLLLGRELADTLLFESQRVIPVALENDGFTFAHRTIDVGLEAVLSSEST